LDVCADRNQRYPARTPRREAGADSSAGAVELTTRELPFKKGKHII
jgi:hypothetical protein